ncbi:OmpA family protein, partial [bacterium]|nr:OmpA family protein [bacterium]
AWFLKRVLALRTGLNMDRITSGLSFRYAGSGTPLVLQFDYAFTYPLQIYDTWGSHRFGITVNWSRQQTPPDEKALQASEASVVLDRAIVHEPMVPETKEGYEQPPYQISERERKLRELLVDIKDYEPKPLLFKIDEDVLLETNYSPLDFIGGLLRKYPDLKIRIAGHTCNLGPEAYNMKLSRQRAEAVQNYIRRKYGIKPENIILEYYGESRPIAPNDVEQNRKKNRRVDVYLVILALTM